MHYRLTRWTICCIALSLTGCGSLFPPLQVKIADPADDSFCQVYQRVIQAQGEGKITAADPVKRRIAANEVTYKCQCENWPDPICKGPKP